MKLIYKGKYLEESQLPVREHPAGSVPFREPSDMKKLALVATLLALGFTALGFLPWFLRARHAYADFGAFMKEGYLPFFLGILVSLVLCVPHELLHAVCFRDTVELYTNLRKGMLFVVGTEDMSRGRFVFMSLLPNLLFGAVPLALAVIFPKAAFPAGLGIFAFGSGAGDYMNVFNCLTQVPRDAKVYMSGLHSYWYRPESGR